LTPQLIGLYVDEALGRAGAIIAALTVATVPADGDVDWAKLAAHSLKGLTAQAGDTHLAERVHAVETHLEELSSLDGSQRSTATTAIVEQLRAIERALTANAGPGISRDIALDEIAGAADAEVRRVAARRGIDVSVELTVPSGIRVPRRIGGVLVDALGHILRNAVTHGSPHGGAIRIAFRREPDAMSIVVGDRGNAASRAAERVPDLESGRGVGLQAAHSRLTAIGGELTLSPAPWGGTSVTVRVPL
jgi:chemotaxis protein histidine kinase CheA